MLRIIICDDNTQDMEQIHTCVTKTLFDLEDIQLSEVRGGKELIAHLEQNPDGCDLLLLDIGMEPVDGMQAAAYIRDQKLDMDIIFITKSTDHVYKGYQYRAYAYILKDHVTEELPQALTRYVEEIRASEAYINVVTGGEKQRVPLSSVLYFESNGRKLILHQKNGEIEFYGKMSEIQEEMEQQGFVRIHQSYLVSRDEIRMIRRDSVIVGEVELPVSRRYAEQVKHLLD